MAPRRGLGDTDPFVTRPRRLPPVIPITGDGPTDDADDRRGTPVPAAAAEPATAAKQTKTIGRGKTQVTSYINTGVLDSARDTVLSVIARPGGHRSLSGLVEEAIRREIVRLQDEFNHGKPFPKREVELRSGRVAGS